MQKRPTKKQLRDQINHEINDFINHGGSVLELPRGATGLADGRSINAIAFERASESRTPVENVLKTIDQRREQARKPAKALPKKPKKKIIYDDFGDPIRVVWEE